MVERNSVARITHFQHQGFDTAKIDGEMFRRGIRFHHAALPENFPVAHHEEFHAGWRFGNLVVDANAGRKCLDGIFQVNV